MWEYVIWGIYSLCVGVFILWCILPFREFLQLLRDRRSRSSRPSSE